MTETPSTYAIGFDFGTGSVRALLVDLNRGGEVARAEYGYAHGRGGVIEDAVDPNLARQWPGDYLVGMRQVIRELLAHSAVAPTAIVGIGTAATASTPIPVDRELRPLCEDARFAAHPAAMAWLWKDHTAYAEAQQITALARELRPQYLARCGGAYQAEWFWAKALRCLRVAPEVFASAHAFVELCDFIPAHLCGQRDAARLRRSSCAAGHKALVAPDWGGMPDATFLGALAPELAALRSRLSSDFRPADQRAGGLSAEVACSLGLAPGTAVAVGAIDAHLGAVGAGIRTGDLVKVIGTSTCDMAIGARRGALPVIAGISGIVVDSIVPGFIGFEAGQSAVGDLFEWCAQHVGHRDHASLTRDAARSAPGATGLLALDWHAGNRCVLADPELSGLVIGLHLHTRDHEIYRAMLEASAFGARMIQDRLVAGGVPIERVIACGGIAHKSELLLQIYADVLQRPIHVAASHETVALGAAIMGAVAGGAFADVPSAQARLCPPTVRELRPDPHAAAIYERLFALYRQLHDAFGHGQAGNQAGTRAGTRAGSGLGTVMKDLLALRRSVTQQ